MRDAVLQSLCFCSSWFFYPTVANRVAIQSRGNVWIFMRVNRINWIGCQSHSIHWEMRIAQTNKAVFSMEQFSGLREVCSCVKFGLIFTWCIQSSLLAFSVESEGMLNVMVQWSSSIFKSEIGSMVICCITCENADLQTFSTNQPGLLFVKSDVHLLLVKCLCTKCALMMYVTLYGCVVCVCACVQFGHFQDAWALFMVIDVASCDFFNMMTHHFGTRDYWKSTKIYAAQVHQKVKVSVVLHVIDLQLNCLQCTHCIKRYSIGTKRC